MKITAARRAPRRVGVGRAGLVRLTVTLCLAALAQTAPTEVMAQSVGGSCSPMGSMTPYDTTGILICSRSNTWKPLLKAVSPSQFGQNAAMLEVVQSRLAGAMRAIVNGVRDEIGDLTN